MPHQEFEEEDFEGALSGRILRRMLGLTRPHWPLLVGFVALIAFVAVQDGTLTSSRNR